MSRRDRNEKAAEYFRRAPGYSAEAIEYLRFSAAKEGMDDESRETVALFRWLSDRIEEAHKVALPTDGKLFDVTPEALGRYVEMVKAPPFPSTVLEFTAITNTPRKELCGVVLLCVVVGDYLWVYDVSSRGVPNWDGCGPTDLPGVLAWSVNPFCLGFLLGARRQQAVRPPVNPEVIQLSDENGMLIAFGSPSRMALRIAQEWGLIPMQFVAHALVSVAETLAALSCTNVTTEVIRPNREAHAIKPASTLFDYHVLVLKPGAPHDPSTPGDGTHASPRTHLRRGHIRRHATAGRIWVNSCVVNPGAIGSVNKDYAVMPGRQRP